MKKRKSKKKRKFTKFFRKLIVLFVLLLIIFLLGTLLYYFFEDNIHNINVTGNKYLSDQEIIDEAKLDNYPGFFKTMPLTVAKNIKKNPLIKEAKVRKRLFYKINIEIKEYKVLFYRLDTGKTVLENGNEIDYKDEDAPILINYVPDKKYETLIKKYSKIDNEVVNKISEIEYIPNEYDEDRFLLYMNDKNRVYVTLTKFGVLNKYNEAITKLEGKTGTLYLDSGNYFKYD